MACLSLAFFEQLLIWCVVVAAVYALVELLIPFVLSNFGTVGSILGQALRIVLWAMIAIIIIMVIFSLISCLLGGGLHLPTIR